MRSVSSSTQSRARSSEAVRSLLFTSLFALVLLVASLFAVADRTAAQSIYGSDAAYGSEVYSAEAGDTSRLAGAPNTGFLPESSPLFWGSASVVVIALILGALTTRRIIKRKQEN